MSSPTHSPETAPYPTQQLVGRLLLFLFSGQVLSAGLSVLTGKLLASYIPPAELGTYNLLLAVMTLVHTLLIVPIIQSFKTEVTQASLPLIIPYYTRLLLIAFVLTLLTALGAGSWLAEPALLLGVWFSSLGQGIYALGNDFLNISGRTKRLTILQLAYTLTNLVMLASLVVLGGQRTTGALVFVLMTVNALLAISSLWQSRAIISRASWTLLRQRNKQLWARFRQYALPIVNLAGWGWLINYADRFILNYMTSAEEVGLYSAGYSLGAKIALLGSPFMLALTSDVYQAKTNNRPDQSARSLRRTLSLFWIIGGSAWLLYASLYQLAGTLLLDNQYASGFIIGPIVGFGYLILTSIQFTDVQRYAYGETRLITYHNLVGALTNIGFNLLLVPPLGGIGAAISTCIGYMTQFFFLLFMRTYFTQS